MPWGATRFLFLIGALSLFIFGMKTMTEGIQASAGIRLRQILESMTKNRVTGVLSGFLLTGVLQSSSATTVMTVSFVNAGLISLAQSAGIMMGANMGTTITGWIVSLLGFRVDITVYALAILAVAAPLLFMRKTEFRSWGTALTGFALLFMGLGFLKETVPTFSENSGFVQLIISYANIPVLGVIMFVILGIIITLIVQSSSTAITLTMAFCATGVIPFEAAAAMVLGENIGTTATAEVAALVGNVHAKRSARIHTLFNIIGALWMVFLIPYVLPLIGKFLAADPYSNTDAGHQAATIGLAAFHSVFNLTNVLLLIWFVPQLVKLATKTVRSRGRDDETFRLEYIDTAIQISEISLVEAKNELVKFGDITMRMCSFVRKLLTETDSDVQDDMHKRIQKYEKITDKMEVEIANYCARLSRMELSNLASERVRAILSISNNLESLGDVFYKMSSTIERKSAAKIWFTPDQRINLLEMFDLINKALANMLNNLEKDESEEIDINYAKDLERKLNKMRNHLKHEYIRRIESGNYNMRSGSVYSDLFSSLEKAGDHIINVSEALAGEI
ncbi:Na/Pi cotransporter family protein [Cryomorpha ignava]|uniref:Na/Pi cotransporter family protein n=2 Tax=Cryomorpha ignava TaxID=101383 RepID=A0A7K3WTY0_9FLAO|nr:Na/Pi cotransporter family protein [Cryomorpha ignava]